MSSSSSPAIEPDTPDLICQLDNVQGMVDALTCVRWKRHQVFISILPKFNLGFFFDFLKTSPFPGCFSRIIWTRNSFDCWRIRLSSSQSLSSTRGIDFWVYLKFSKPL